MLALSEKPGSWPQAAPRILAYEKKRLGASSRIKKLSPFRYFKTSPEVIRLAVMMYVRYRLSLSPDFSHGAGASGF
jgi:hypothetical protein